MITISIPDWMILTVCVLLLASALLTLIGDFLKWRCAKLTKQIQESKETLEQYKE